MFLSFDSPNPYTCGNLEIEFSGMVPKVVSTIVLIIKIAVPIVLIIFGSIDFLKAVSASKEDEIKKGQQTFIKRLIAGVLVFLIIQIVQIIIRFASSGNDKKSITDCFNCFINGTEGAKDVNGCYVKESNNGSGNGA